MRCLLTTICVVGYITPVRNWHKGKREEYRQRRMVDISAVTNPPLDPNRPIPEPEPYTGCPQMADDVEPLR